MSAGLQVADIFRRHGDADRRTHDGRLGRVERRVMSAIELCRTAELGERADCPAFTLPGRGLNLICRKRSS